MKIFAVLTLVFLSSVSCIRRNTNPYTPPPSPAKLEVASAEETSRLWGRFRFKSKFFIDFNKDGSYELNDEINYQHKDQNQPLQLCTFLIRGQYHLDRVLSPGDNVVDFNGKPVSMNLSKARFVLSLRETLYALNYEKGKIEIQLHDNDTVTSNAPADLSDDTKTCVRHLSEHRSRLKNQAYPLVDLTNQYYIEALSAATPLLAALNGKQSVGVIDVTEYFWQELQARNLKSGSLNELLVKASADSESPLKTNVTKATFGLDVANRILTLEYRYSAQTKGADCQASGRSLYHVSRVTLDPRSQEVALLPAINFASFSGSNNCAWGQKPIKNVKITGEFPDDGKVELQY